MTEAAEQQFQKLASSMRAEKIVKFYSEERFNRLRNGGIHTWSQDDDFIDWCLKNGYEDVLEKEVSK